MALCARTEQPHPVGRPQTRLKLRLITPDRSPTLKLFALHHDGLRDPHLPPQAASYSAGQRCTLRVMIVDNDDCR
jgi:hypothetical protein